LAGIYLHIPFCKQACNYCNFHFSTSLKYKKELIAAMATELSLRAAYLKDPVSTVYFGGGTPSLLDEADLDTLWNAIYKHYKVANLQECTFEANPDDLTEDWLKMLKNTPVDRLSIGIQSFKAADLLFMHRAHNAEQAALAVQRAQDAGFSNITVDLIYGTPGLSDIEWKHNLMRAVALGVQHISSYALTVEEKTLLAHEIKKGKLAAPKTEQSARQFEILQQTLSSAGFVQYEISNFGLPDFFAVHNTNYWKGEHYLGIGPSAHSFNGRSRQWNIANNAAYMHSLSQQNLNFELEVLSIADQINEYMLTGLRTIWGIEQSYVAAHFGEFYWKEIIKNLATIPAHHFTLDEQKLVLTDAGKMFADGIAAALFF
jgi:oxygen-independent coproporphyrinogen-3 oxidase